MSDVPVTKTVLTPVTPVTGPLFSLRAYARHRQVSATAVHRAIESGRLSKCVVRDAAGKFRGITDLALADREWAEATDLTKAPAAVVERTEQEQQGATADQPPAADEEPPADTAEGGRVTFGNALAREKYWKGKTAELEYKERIGQVADAKEYEAQLAEEYSNCRTRLLGIARRAKAALPHLSHADIVTIDNLVREALESLAGPAPAAQEPEDPPTS